MSHRQLVYLIYRHSVAPHQLPTYHRWINRWYYILNFEFISQELKNLGKPNHRKSHIQIKQLQINSQINFEPKGEMWTAVVKKRERHHSQLQLALFIFIFKFANQVNMRGSQFEDQQNKLIATQNCKYLSFQFIYQLSQLSLYQNESCQNFEGLPLTEALLKYKSYEKHKRRVKEAKAYHIADEDMTQVNELINSYQYKKTLRTQFSSKNKEGEMHVAHQRLLRQFFDIDKGKRLSVGPAATSHKGAVSPVEEMHSLNFVNKVKESARIDNENEKIIQILSQTPSAILKRDELANHQELLKKLNFMLSRKSKNGVDQVAKMREVFLKKTFSKVSSKLDFHEDGKNSSRSPVGQKMSLQISEQNSIEIAQTSVTEADSKQQSHFLPEIDTSQAQIDLKKVSPRGNLKKSMFNPEYSIQKDDTLRLQRVYKGNHNLNHTQNASPTSYTPTLTNSNKKEQLKKLKQEVSAIAQKIRSGKTSNELNTNVEYSLFHQNGQRVSLPQIDVNKDSITLPQVNSVRGSLDLKGSLKGKMKTLGDQGESDLQINENSILAMSSSNNKLSKVAKMNNLGTLRQRNAPPFDAMPGLSSQFLSNDSKDFLSPTSNQFSSKIMIQKSFQTEIFKKRESRSNFESHDRRGIISKTKIVVQFNGSPLQILQWQKDQEYKMRAILANERNIFKHNQAYWATTEQRSPRMASVSFQENSQEVSKINQQQSIEENPVQGETSDMGKSEDATVIEASQQ